VTSEIFSYLADAGIGMAALALGRSARQLAAAATATNGKQDERLDKLVGVAENHEKRLTALETRGG
jgi:hypothetical protein